jgi:6-phosphofructokinase 2
MSPIITLTFSPCIDKSTSVSSLVPEKKLRCSVPKFEPGGGGINVARVIKRLGGNVIAIFPSGGHSGKYFNDLMEKENVVSIPIESTYEVRENLTVLNEASNDQFRFIMPGPVLHEDEWQQCLKAIEKVKGAEYIVASGSLPPGSPVHIFAQLTKVAVKMNARLIVDTSGEALNNTIREGAYLIKPNLAELASLGGKEWVEIKDVELLAKEIIRNNKCSIIIVSLGKEGAILVTENETYRVNAPEVVLKSTVGAGDSMVGGVVYSISQGMTLKQALAYGVACGTAATINPGTGLCRKEDADQLFTQIVQ